MISTFGGLVPGNPAGWLFTILICVTLFFIVREIVTWYWKQSRIVELLEEIRDLLQQQDGRAAVKPISEKLTSNKGLLQPFSEILFMKIVGVIFLIAGFVAIFGKHLVYGLSGLGLAAVLLLIVAVLERKQGKLASHVRENE